MTNNSVSPAILLARCQVACDLMHLASCGLLLSESDDFRIPKSKALFLCKAFQAKIKLAPSISLLKDDLMSCVCDASTDILVAIYPCFLSILLLYSYRQVLHNHESPSNLRLYPPV